MYFPVAGVEVAPYIPPLVAFGISFFASMGGISGAFLLLPFQVSVLGYTNPSVSATNQFYNIVSIPSGVWRYVREKRMVWPLAMVIAIGTLPGVFIGTLLRIVYLPDPKQFKLFAACVLLYIGLRLINSILRKDGNRHTQKSSLPPFATGQPAVRILEFSSKRITYEFAGEVYGCPTPGLFCLSLVIGVIGGAYGIGGGAIIAPFLVSWFRLPVHTLSGATLMGTFLTSISAVAFFIFLAPFFPNQSTTPDWLLGALFGVGGLFGMYLGASLQKFVPALYIKWMLALVITGTSLKYYAEFFL